MAQKTKVQLKTFFETGDKPTQAEFGDLIDSFLNFLDNENRIIKHLKVSLTSTNVNNLGNTFIELIAAPGAGKFIDLLTIFCKINAGAIPWGANTILQASYDTATLPVLEADCLGADAGLSRIVRLQDISAVIGGADTQILVNKAVQIQTAVGNPTAGDGTVDIYLAYRILTQ